MFRKFELILLLVMQIVCCVPRVEAAEFKYTPFPRLQSTTVQPNDLAERLLSACKAPDVTTGAAEEVVALQKTCKKLLKAKPENLDDERDMAVLRQFRDDPSAFQTLKAADGAGASDAIPATPSVGAFSDRLIRGMAEFLSKRAQEEALRYLRNELKTELCGDTGEDTALRQAAFKNTCEALEALDDGMSLEAIGSFIRAAAEKDLRQLPDVGLAYAEQKQDREANLTFAGRLGLAYFDAVRSGKPAIDVLYALSELQFQTCETARTCGATSVAVRLASAVGYALRQGGGPGEDWYMLYEKLSVEERPVFAVAVLLLAEKRLKELGAPRDLGFKLTADSVNRAVVRPLVVLDDVLALVKTWNALEERLEKELSEDARREVLLEAMVEGADELARAVSNLDSVINGDSGSQVPHAMERLRVLSGVAADLARRNYASAVVVVLQEWEAAGGAGSLPASVRRYVPFVVELASAQSSNEVAATFDAYAAPLGTYELKYKRSMVALNGFVGGHAGWERLGSEGVTATNTIIGGFAPVGVHGSFPVSDHLHLGFVLSVLDLGAVTTAKVDNEEPEGDLEGADPQTEPQASKAAEIGFEQVFSPGAYAVVGLGGSPFVAGFGVSMTPELREVRQDGLRTAVSVLRYGAFLAVDIPIVPLD